MSKTKKIVISIVILGILSPFALVGYFLFSFDYDISKLVNYNPEVTSRIYDKDGKKNSKYF